MNANIRYPNISGGSEAAQLLQVKSYLHQLVDQLNMTLKDVERGAATSTSAAVSGVVSQKTDTGATAQSTFNAIKALIIKSADIVNAYYDEINTRLEGVYVAESDFGDYAQKTTQDIEANSESIKQLFTNVQTVVSRVEGIAGQTIEANAYINSGLLYTDENSVPVYGVEIGQTVEIDGVKTFDKFARFTADKLSFYDQNGSEVAYVSDKKLYINHVQVTGTFVLGGFEDTVQGDGSVVTKWIGGGS